MYMHLASVAALVAAYAGASYGLPIQYMWAVGFISGAVVGFLGATYALKK